MWLRVAVFFLFHFKDPLYVNRVLQAKIYTANLIILSSYHKIFDKNCTYHKVVALSQRGCELIGVQNPSIRVYFVTRILTNNQLRDHFKYFTCTLHENYIQISTIGQNFVIVKKISGKNRLNCFHIYLHVPKLFRFSEF